MNHKRYDKQDRFASIEKHLLNTFFSGLYVSSADLMKIAADIGIPMQMNSREFQIKELLNKSYDSGKADAAINLLTELIDERVQEYHRLGLDYPATKEQLNMLIQKANRIKTSLQEGGESLYG